MNLRQLQYFVTLAQERNFTRAAEQLGIAQPPLSRQIRDLEEEFGAPLLSRETRPVALTDAGRLLLEHATRILMNVDQMRSAMRNLILTDRQRFVIGFVGSTIYGPVPELIRQFRLAAPELEVDLIEMNTVQQMTALKEGRIDAGLGRLEFEDDGIARRIIERETLVVAVPAGHPWAERGNPVPLSHLQSETLILYPSEPRPSYADQVLAILRDRKVTPKALREVRELQTALGLVAAQSGVCLVPASVQRLRRDDINYCPLDEPTATSPIILSWRAADISSSIDVLMRVCDRIAQ